MKERLRMRGFVIPDSEPSDEPFDDEDGEEG